MADPECRGHFDPERSSINFAVPSMSVLRITPKVLPTENLSPGILQPAIDIIHASSRATPAAFKVCVDGMYLDLIVGSTLIPVVYDMTGNLHVTSASHVYLSIWIM